MVRSCLYLLVLSGCAGRIDASDHPIEGDPDAFAFALDRGDVSVTEGLWSLRSIAEWRGRAPEITAEVADGVLLAGADCGGRASCVVSFVLEARAGAPGSAVIGEGTVDIGAGFSAALDLEVGIGSVVAPDLGAELIGVGTSASWDLTWTAAPPSIDIDAGEGPILVTLPTGDYDFDLPDGVEPVGLSDVPGAVNTVRLRSGGSVRVEAG